jgi:hypothetical protein
MAESEIQRRMEELKDWRLTVREGATKALVEIGVLPYQGPAAIPAIYQAAE